MALFHNWVVLTAEEKIFHYLTHSILCLKKSLNFKKARTKKKNRLKITWKERTNKIHAELKSESEDDPNDDDEDEFESESDQDNDEQNDDSLDDNDWIKKEEGEIRQQREKFKKKFFSLKV